MERPDDPQNRYPLIDYLQVPESPLRIALAQEHRAFLRTMLEGGLDPNYKDGGLAIIFDVTDNYKLELLKLLV